MEHWNKVFFLLIILGQGTNQQEKLDKMEESYTFQRYPASLTQDLQDRKKQFEKCGLWVVQV